MNMLGIGGMNLSISNAKERYPDLYDLVNRGSVFTFSDGKSITAQYLGNGSLSIGAWGVREESWMKKCGHDVHDPKSIKEYMAKDYRNWAPELVKLTQVADEDNMTARLLHMMPVGHRWENRPGVTLIGDSAHLMTPFAGEGLNLAMKDAMLLARSISEAEKEGGKKFLAAKVKSFEEDMFKRATVFQEITRANMEDMYFTEGSPRTVIERYLSRTASTQVNPFFMLFLRPMIYIYFFCFKLFH